MKLSIVILNYNTRELTLECARSVLGWYKKEIDGRQIEIIVADNGSTDGTKEVFKKMPSLKFFENGKNYGFGKGSNLAAKKAKGEYILFLNSDVKVLDNSFLKMTSFLGKNPNIGILGARLKNPDKTLQKSAGNFYTPLNLFLTLFGADGSQRKSPGKIEKVDWVSGASLMIRNDLFKNLGGFDEAYFMYIEDMDLCFRAKKLGFQTYFYPHTNVIHRELGSGNRTFAILQIYRGILIFYKKHIVWALPLAKLLLFIKSFISLLIGIFTNNSYLKNTYFPALKLSL